MRVERVTIPDFERMVREGRVKDAPTLAAWALLRVAE